MIEYLAPPWMVSPLNEWSIVGMNHYAYNGERFLFVAMVREGRCIKVEGPDTAMLWDELRSQAEWEMPVRAGAGVTR